ncbi:hypothetical protein SDJN02_04766, partial [Cucurbita argyrosperma subsp. argyrosperma]
MLNPTVEVFLVPRPYRNQIEGKISLCIFSSPVSFLLEVIGLNRYEILTTCILVADLTWYCFG